MPWDAAESGSKQVAFPINDRGMTASETLAAVVGQTRKFTQGEANYLPLSDEGEDRNCRACFFYQASLTSCQAVDGEISSSGISDIFISGADQRAALEDRAKGDKMKGKHKKEFKTVPAIQIKLDEDQGIVDHLVAVMGNLDLGGDVIHPGAFTKTIQERGHKVRVVDSHNYDSALDVVGKPVALWEVSREDLPPDVVKDFPEATGGLMARTQFLMDTEEGRGIFNRIKAGAIDEWSIGYDAVDHDFSNSDNGPIRNLRQIRLWEYSPVVFGMNPATTTLNAKDEKGVSGSTSLPVGPRDRAWDAPAAINRVRAVTGSEDEPSASYKQAFFWYDADSPDQFGSYKLPFADVIGGELTAIPRGIFNGAARLDQTDIPESDKAGVMSRMSRYYARMRTQFDDESLVPPWEKSEKDVAEIVEIIKKAEQDVLEDSLLTVEGIIQRHNKVGRTISARNAGRIMETIQSLMDFLAAAGVDTSALYETDEEEETMGDKQKRYLPDSNTKDEPQAESEPDTPTETDDHSVRPEDVDLLTTQMDLIKSLQLELDLMEV